MLTTELNNSIGAFKAHKYESKKNDGSNRQELRLGTLIISARPYNEKTQAKLVTEFPSTMANLIDQNINLRRFNSLSMVEFYKEEKCINL